MDENETELIENEQIQTNSESSKPDHHKEERSKPYNLRTLDLRDPKKKTNDEPNHRMEKQMKAKATKKQKESKNKVKTNGAQRELAQRVRKPTDILGIN